MKVSYNWLKDFVDIRVNPKALADKLTMAGLEVASCETNNNDTVLEIEVTANRPDCLSVLGIAQEAAAVLGKKLKVKLPRPKIKSSKQKKKLVLPAHFINIQDKKDCALYRGCLISGVKIGPSPTWLKNRIESLGCRPVNNVVDITNYCLLEYGQPLHAFDHNKIVERIIVRRAKNREKILTIDGDERILSENILVISDKNKAIAIAGIMGDKLSEVDSTTKNILLESAYFDPILIRRGSRELGLSSESSYRFERQVDLDRVKIAQDRAIKLICEIAGGQFIGEKEDGAKPKHKPHQVKFDCARASSLLAVDVSVEKAKKIFGSLGFSCKGFQKDKITVTIPALRRDIKIEEDLVEEVARIHGYAKVPSTLPAIRSALIENFDAESIKQPVRQILRACGFSEVINYSLISKDVIDLSGMNKEATKLINPLSSEQEYLRPMLAGGLLNCLAYNLNHKNLDLQLFELGHVFSSDYCETASLGLIATGKLIDDWQLKKDIDFFTLKGEVQSLLGRLGFGQAGFVLSEDNRLFSEGVRADIICQEDKVGILGKIDASILLNFGIKYSPNVFYAEIFLDQLCKCAREKKKFVPLELFPSIIRDLSLIARTSIRFEEIADIITTEAGGYLKNFRLIDTYKGTQIDPGCTGLTISLELGLANRTLTDEEADRIQQKIVTRLKSDLEVRIR